MTNRHRQASVPYRRSFNQNTSDGCCIRDCIFTNRCLSSTNRSQSERKRKLTLVSSEQTQIQKNFSVINKPKKKSITTIMEPQYNRSSSAARLSSNVSNEDKMRKSSYSGSQAIQPKPIIQIITKPNIYSNINIEFTKFDHQILGYSSIKQKQRPKSSLNAIKATKIKINPLILARPSTVMEVSYSPVTKGSAKLDAKEGSTKLNPPAKLDDKYFNPVKLHNISPIISTPLSVSIVEQKTDRQTYSANSIENTPSRASCTSGYFSDLKFQQVQSPMLRKSIASINQSPSVSQNNVSDVIFKIEVQGAYTELEPEDLRRGEPFVKNKSKNCGRTMTFAGEGTSDISQNIEEEDFLSGIFDSFKKLVNYEQYFNRGGFIGAGRISTVYRSEDKKTKLLMASKEVFKKIVYQKDMSHQISKSIDDHYKLPIHQNILTLYGTFEDAGRYYFMTELCETNLRDMMKKQKISEDVALKYLQQILQGLEILHKNKIIHKYLKPENILISLDVCKVGDFGWANKLLEMSNHLPSFEYTSPELGNGESNIDEKTDIWSVGIMAFEMIVGDLPFSSEKDMILANKEKIQTFSKKYQRLLSGLLKIHPDDRLSASSALQLIQSQGISKMSLSKIQELIS